MKVTIRKYPAWVGPYQLVEKIFFWARQKDEYGIEREADWVYSIGDWLAHTWFGGWWSGVSYNWTHYHGKRQVKVRIDYWDTWSMDHTLGYIVLPMLKQLKATKHGSPMIDDADVPHLPKQGRASNESMQADLFDSDEHDQLCWKQYEERWEWVINEIIFAFESLVGNNEDWEDKYWTEKNFDIEGRMKEGERIRNGFRLFGTYYTALWD